MKRLWLQLTIVLLATPIIAAENWPQWRGPKGNGVVPGASNLPVKWSETENVLWKVPMPAWSGSTPAVWGDRIFLASPERNESPQPTQEGRRGRTTRDPGGENLLLICYNLADGKQLWTRNLGGGNYFKMKQNMSSPSPVTDGEHVWISTGTGVVACFDFEGNEKWRINLQEAYGRFGLNHGYANSPLLYEDRLIIPVLHGMTTDDPSYLLAIEKATGKEIWRTERPTEAIKESPDSYATPQLLIHDGKPQIVINGGDVVTAHDMMTGKEIWRVEGMNPNNSPMYRVIASCVVAGDLILAPTRKNPLTAIKAGGEGLVTDTHVLWRFEGGPDVPCPVTDGKYVWLVDDRGVFRCLEAATGKELYEPQRIATGTYSSSPVLADGKIYAMNEIGTTTVLEAGPEFKVLATNEINAGYTLSSPVIVGNRILLRTESNLYLIGEK